jgi:Bacterial regulatory proteins, gntR family
MPRWPDDETAVYRRIAAHLREGIFTGRYTNYLPSTFVLSGKFGCSQSTVSRAYEVLKNEGLTHSTTGHTPYVLIRTPPRFTGDGYVKVLVKGKPALFCTRCWMPAENRDRRCCGTGNATRVEPAGNQPAGIGLLLILLGLTPSIVRCLPRDGGSRHALLCR